MAEKLISEQIARFVVWTQFKDLEPHVIEKTQHHILDTLGCGIAGALSKESGIFEKVLARTGESDGLAPLWGKGIRVNPKSAAMGNAIACHAFEIDDTNGCDHSGAVVLPACFAALSMTKEKVSGKEFLIAVLLGYEVARRALEACGSYESHNAAGWNSTGTCGTFGAAAATARLLGLNVEQTQSALGLASSFSGGTWSFIHDGAQSKRLHPGNAARGGLLSSLLAQEGFEGSKSIFENVWGGFTKTIAPETQQPQKWTEDLGSKWKILTASIKPYAANRSIHSSIDAVDLILKKYPASADDIRSIQVRLNPFVYSMCSGRELDPLVVAQSSLAFGIAARVIYGQAGLTAYEKANRHARHIRNFMEKIVLTSDDSQKSADEPIVEINFEDGRRFEKRVDYALGSKQYPLSEKMVIDKFFDASKKVFDEDVLSQFPKLILNLSELDDVRTLEELLAGRPLTREPLNI